MRKQTGCVMHAEQILPMLILLKTDGFCELLRNVSGSKLPRLIQLSKTLTPSLLFCQQTKKYDERYRGCLTVSVRLLL